MTYTPKLIICATLALTACGGGGGTSSTTAVTPAATPTGVTVATVTDQIAAGSGTVAVRGLSTRFQKTAQAVPTPVTLYNQGAGVIGGLGVTNSNATPVATQSGNVVTGSLSVNDALSGNAKAGLQTDGSFVGGALISDFDGTGGTPIPDAGRSGGTTGTYSQASLAGSMLVSYIDGPDSDTEIDLALVDLVVGQQSVTEQFEEVGIFYGGHFASQAAVNAVSAAATSGSVTYARTDSGGPDNAGLFSISTSEGSLTNSQLETFAGDTSVTVNFGTNAVNGRISNIRDADAGIGVSPFNFDVTFNGTLNGTHFDGGTVAITAVGTNTSINTLSTSATAGSFMGASAETITGVMQAQGTLTHPTLRSALNSGAGSNADLNDTFFLNGRFTADQ